MIKCDRCGKPMTNYQLMNEGEKRVCHKCGRLWSKIYDEHAEKHGDAKTQEVWHELFSEFIGRPEKVVFT